MKKITIEEHFSTEEHLDCLSSIIEKINRRSVSEVETSSVSGTDDLSPQTKLEEGSSRGGRERRNRHHQSASHSGGSAAPGDRDHGEGLGKCALE